MGFLQRIFSMGSKKSKKQRPQIVHKVDPKQRAQEEEEHEAAVGRLLRSSSTRYTVVSEVEYSSLPPLPHPINDVLQAVNPQATRTRGASTTSIASSTISQRGTYNVTVHKRKQHNPIEQQPAQEGAMKFESIRESKEISSQLLELRAHPSVASLLDVYDEQGRIPEQAFSNSPPSRERAQTRRSGSTLRQLLGQAPSMSSRKHCEDGAGAVEGDISWAERFLGEADSVSSPESSIEIQTPSTRNTHFDHQNKVHNLSFTSEHDRSMITHENPAISSMEVELSVDSTTSIEIKPSITPYKSPNPTLSQRASQVFQFLTERRQSTCNAVQERSSPELPSAFSVSSEERSTGRSLDGHSHFSEDSSDAMVPIHSATPSDTSIPQVNPLFTSKSTPASSSQTEENTSYVNTSPANIETVWVASDARRRNTLLNAPSKVIITAPTPSGKSGTPSRIPRGPRGQYRKASSSSSKSRRASTLAERSMNSPASRLKSKRDPFTPVPVKHKQRRTPSDGSIPSTCSRNIEISPPTRLSRKASNVHSIVSEPDKENGAELSVKTTLPSTPLRSKSDSRSLFRTAVTPVVFRPPPSTIPSPASSSDLSPVGRKLMMDVRKQRSKACNAERQNGSRFGYTGA